MDNKNENTADENTEIYDANFDTTESIEVPERLIDQVIGQEHAVEVVKKSC